MSPTLSNVLPSVTVTAGLGDVTLSPSVVVTDPGNLDLTGATVSVTGGTFAGDGDLLGAVNHTSGSLGPITWAYDSASETLTLSGTDTLADYQRLLDTVVFEVANPNGNENGSHETRTITWVLNDGGASNNLSTAQTETVTVASGPFLITTQSVGYTEGAGAVALATNARLVDFNSTTLVSATVALRSTDLSNGTFTEFGQASGDVLLVDTTGTAITASYNSTTETLTLSGADSVANYQQVLDSVEFNNTSENPANYGSDPARLISWTLNDGGASNNTATTSETIDITPVNQPPTLSNVAAIAFSTEEQAATTLSPSLSVSDPDDLDLVSATAAITGGSFSGDGDVLAISGATSGTVGAISFSYNSSAETLTLTGTDTLANYQTALDDVTFQTVLENPTDFGSKPFRDVVWTVNDGSGTANGGAQLSTPVTEFVRVNNVNDAPTLTQPSASASFTEEAEPVILSDAVSVSDPDDVRLSAATVQITGGTFANDQDVLTAGDIEGTHVAVSYNSSTETLTLTGNDTLANYQSVLDSVTFDAGENPTDYGSNPTRTLVWTLMDPSGTANGGIDISTPVTSTVSIASVNDPPTLSNVASLASVSFPGRTITISPSASASDPDNLNLASATVRITGGTFLGDGDMLAVNGATSGTVGAIAFSYNSTTEVLSLTGSDTLADYSQVFDTVTFNSTNLNPTNSGADPTRTVNWVVNDGAGSNNLSAPATTTITVRQVVSDDFTGDGISDILWGNTSTGEVDTWIMNNGQVVGGAELGVVSSAWRFAGTGDFIGHGTSDVLWQNASTSEVDTWLINDGQLSGGAAIGNAVSVWQPLGTGDLTGTGVSDELWLNTSTGEVDTWLMNNGLHVGGAELGVAPSGFQFAGIGDFNGDGTSDVLWHNTTTGDVDTWLINDGQLTGGAAIGFASSVWQILGAGDFNGDGTSDILWRNTSSGEVDTWLMNNGQRVGGAELGVMSSAWQFASIGNYTTSATADILWRNTNTGEVDTWIVSNDQHTGGTAIGTVSSVWQPQVIRTA